MKQLLKLVQIGCLVLGLGQACYSTNAAEDLLKGIIDNPTTKTILKFLDECDKKDRENSLNLDALPKGKRNKALYAVIDQFEDCYCALEYMNFPWMRYYSTATLKFFAKLPKVDMREKSEEGPWLDDKFKLEMIAQVHWTMSSGPRKLDAEIDTLKRLYELDIQKKTLINHYLEMYPTYRSRLKTFIEVPAFFAVYGLNNAFATPITRYPLLMLMGYGALRLITG